MQLGQLGQLGPWRCAMPWQSFRAEAALAVPRRSTAHAEHSTCVGLVAAREVLYVFGWRRA